MEVEETQEARNSGFDWKTWGVLLVLAAMIGWFVWQVAANWNKPPDPVYAVVGVRTEQATVEATDGVNPEAPTSKRYLLLSRDGGSTMYVAELPPGCPDYAAGDTVSVERTVFVTATSSDTIVCR